MDKNTWIFIGALAAFFTYRFIKNAKIKKELPELYAQGAIIVDVRSTGEFQAANNPNSINIPLDQFESGSSKLPKDKPIILCCASGARSGMATGILRAKGFAKVVNAGSWTNTL